MSGPWTTRRASSASRRWGSTASSPTTRVRSASELPRRSFHHAGGGRVSGGVRFRGGMAGLGAEPLAAHDGHVHLAVAAPARAPLEVSQAAEHEAVAGLRGVEREREPGLLVLEERRA